MNKKMEYLSNDCLNYNFQKSVYTFEEFDENVEKMVSFVYDRIDESDYFYFYFKSNDLIDEYKQIFNYTFYKKIILLNKRIFNNVYVFDISSKENKEKFKNIFKFNVSDESRWPYKIETDIINIANDEHMFEDWVYFYKNDKLVFNMNVFDGWIQDYRKKELWLEMKREPITWTKIERPS